MISAPAISLPVAGPRANRGGIHDGAPGGRNFLSGGASPSAGRSGGGRAAPGVWTPAAFFLDLVWRHGVALAVLILAAFCTLIPACSSTSWTDLHAPNTDLPAAYR